MMMTISFHFRDLFLSDFVLLTSFFSLFIGTLLIKKDKQINSANLLIVGSVLAVLWQITNFFIPGIFLHSPTDEDLEFLGAYGLIFNDLLPGTIFIVGIGILPLLVCYKNKASDSIQFLAIGAIIFIISIVIGIDLSNWVLSTISVLIILVSMIFFSLYGIKLKNWGLILFSILYFISKIVFLMDLQPLISLI